MSKPTVKKKDSNTFDYMKTNKDNLQNIILNPSILHIIDNLVTRTNKIIIHAYQFIKLYLSFLYQNNTKFPSIDKKFISHVFKVITIRKSNSGGYSEDKMPEQLKLLSSFYQQHYINTLYKNEAIYYDKLPHILAYEAIDMVTNINNNIQQNFINHLNKYVNIVFKLKEKISEITKNNKDKIIRKELHKNLYQEFYYIKQDLCSFNKDYISDIKYHNWINEQKLKLFPNKNKFDHDSIHYDLKSNTQDYLISMFYILEQFEIFNKHNENTDTKEIRLFNVLPLRTNIISKHITIDTCGLISNFIETDIAKNLSNYKKDNNQFNLWNRFFKLNHKSLKKNKYTFNFMIKTDGISVSILFIKLDKNNIPLKKSFKNNTDNFDYIEQVEITQDIKNKKVICIDPGYSDIIYCGAKNEKGDLQTFRYTQNQRRLETKSKKYNKIIEEINTETKISNKSIKEIETKLSKLNSKTINFEKFYKYCIKKNKLNSKLYQHYQQRIFRKLKLNRFINSQKSESKMLNNFKNKFGNPNDKDI
uniref:Uncharacterized protein n=1 Tax=viral metagenome TaxID=1070528 RepID=A0A6C0AEZ4_9ZZZZ